MEDVSIIGLIISLVISILFLIELVFFFSSFNRRKRAYIPLHLLGVIATFWVALFTVTSSIGVGIDSKYLITSVVVLAGIFFVAAAIDSIRVEQVNKFVRK